MRDFAKSALSFSWALSLLGISNAARMLKPEQQKPADVFAPVTEVAINQLDESIRGVYRYGDNIQARLVDTAFSWMNPGNWTQMTSWNFMRSPCSEQRPGRQTQASSDRSTSTTAAAGSDAPKQADAGWGPMPPN
jgi:hypothetical protein